MNLLLLWPAEVSGDIATVTGRRAQHLLAQLGKDVGDQVLVGVIGHSRGRGQVLEKRNSPSQVTLQLVEQTPLPPPPTRLIVAIPRPKALSRLLQHAASFGIARLDLVRTARVEASYLDSKRLTEERVRDDLLLGMEQGRWIHLPQVRVFPHLGALTEQFKVSEQGGPRVILHPGTGRWMSDLVHSASLPSSTLAFGPDGGLLPRELTHFEEHGFQAASLGPGVLRTETAVTAALGQLALCRHLAEAPLPASLAPDEASRGALPGHIDS